MDKANSRFRGIVENYLAVHNLKRMFPPKMFD